MDRARQETLEATLLADADEDYVGLWEAVWTAHSDHADLSPGRCRALAKAAIESWIARGRIALFVKACATISEQPLPRDEWDDALAVEAHGEAPISADSKWIEFSTP